MRVGLPFFDHDKRVIAVRRQRTKTRRVDERRLFDAALLGMHRGHVRLERLEHGVPLTWLRYDFHDYLDHLFVPTFLRRVAFQNGSVASIANRLRRASRST